MFCGECGKQLAEDNQYCPYCGTKISKRNTEITHAPIVEQDINAGPDSEEQMEKEATGWILKWYIGGMLLVALLPLPYLYYSALRFFVFIFSIYVIYLSLTSEPKRKIRAITYSIIALIFIIIRGAERETWAIIDIAISILVFFTPFYKQPIKKHSDNAGEQKTSGNIVTNQIKVPPFIFWIAIIGQIIFTYVMYYTNEIVVSPIADLISIVWVALWIISTIVAVAKGQNFFLWVIYSFFLPLIAFTHVISKNKKKNEV